MVELKERVSVFLRRAFSLVELKERVKVGASKLSYLNDGVLLHIRDPEQFAKTVRQLEKYPVDPSDHQDKKNYKFYFHPTLHEWRMLPPEADLTKKVLNELSINDTHAIQHCSITQSKLEELIDKNIIQTDHNPWGVTTTALGASEGLLWMVLGFMNAFSGPVIQFILPLIIAPTAGLINFVGQIIYIAITQKRLPTKNEMLQIAKESLVLTAKVLVGVYGWTIGFYLMHSLAGLTTATIGGMLAIGTVAAALSAVGVFLVALPIALANGASFKEALVDSLNLSAAVFVTGLVWTFVGSKWLIGKIGAGILKIPGMKATANLIAKGVASALGWLTTTALYHKLYKPAMKFKFVKKVREWRSKLEFKRWANEKINTFKVKHMQGAAAQPNNNIRPADGNKPAAWKSHDESMDPYRTRLNEKLLKQNMYSKICQRLEIQDPRNSKYLKNQNIQPEKQDENYVTKEQQDRIRDRVFRKMTKHHHSELIKQFGIKGEHENNDKILKERFDNKFNEDWREELPDNAL